ncbi:MAG: PKD domain-containing protein [Bacteroidetes bacterium]|nr:MAG: PKD domain-containing protein [Bacteroidota bacterium]TAG89092.1 MAG: PKD domain-containing protein [Bacteroidota bacterium]
MKKNLYYFTIIFLIISSLFLFFSCTKLIELEKIDYVDLKASFFMSDIVAREGQTIEFTQTATIVAKQFDWTFGNQLKSNLPNPTTIYNNFGKYNVTLVVKKEQGNLVDSTKKTITIIPKTQQATREFFFGDATTDEQGFCITDAENNGFLLVGRQAINVLYIVRINNAGVKLWEKKIDNITLGTITPRAAFKTADDDYIIVGNYQYNTTDNDAFIIKLAKDGNSERWRIVRNTSQSEEYTSVVQYGNRILIGGSATSVSTTGVTNKILLEEYNLDGILQSSQTDGTNWKLNSAEFALDGFTCAITEASSPSLIFYNTAFEQRRKRTLDFLEGSANDVTTLDDGFVTVGYYLSNELDLNGNRTKHAFISRISNFAQYDWAIKVRKTEIFAEEFKRVIQLESDESFIAIGTNINPLSGKDILVCKYDKNGNLLKYKLIGNIKDDEGFDVKVISPTEFYIFGTFQQISGLERRDFYLIKLNKDLE